MRNTLTVTLAATVFASSAFAEVKDNRAAAFVEKVGDSTIDRIVDSNASRVEITTLSDSSTVSLRTGSTRSNRSERTGRGVFTTWSVALSSPLSKGSSSTSIATLDGLSNASTVAFSYQRKTAPIRTALPVRSPQFDALYDEVCAAVTEGYKQSANFDPKKPLDSCFTLTNVESYAPARYGEVESLFFDPDGQYSSYGATLSVGQQTFEFLDVETSEKGSATEVPWSFNLNYSIIPQKQSALYTLAFEYQNAFENGPQGTLCPVADVPSVVSCSAGFLSAPTEKKKRLISVEARKSFGGAGASLKVTFDTASDVLGIDLPISFIRDKSKNLTGGVRFGWTDESHDFTARLFVGTKFSIF